MSNQRTSTTAKPINVNTLGMDIALPDGTVITPYKPKNTGKLSKNAKQKQKYTHFSYYQLKDGTIVKILFLDSENYVEISKFPFVKDDVQIKNFKELNDSGAKRLTTAGSLLIGIQNNKTVITRKLQDCKVTQETAEVDTVEDIFEEIPESNRERYNSVLASLKEIKMASLRVIIKEEDNKIEILDFDYFFTERQYAQKFKEYSTKKEQPKPVKENPPKQKKATKTKA